MSDKSCKTTECKTCNEADCIWRPRTKADRIRAMTDEELAEFIIGKSNCGACPNEEQCDDWHIGSCKDAWLTWLQEEVKE